MPTQKIRTDPTVLADLASLGDMRAWSLIITIFGDAVAPRGGSVASITIQAILEQLSIKPEAMRVALHRLVKDGWIKRQKTGRQSFYALSPKGRAEFLPATRRIYANAPSLTGPWQLVVLPAQSSDTTHAMRNAGFIALTTTAHLGHATSGTPPKQALCLKGDTLMLPDWGRNALASPNLSEEYAKLQASVRKIKTTHVNDPMDAVALRILMIHHWRRTLLRHADLPADMFPPHWQGETCRELVLAQHARLSRLADPWLDREIGARTSTS